VLHVDTEKLDDAKMYLLQIQDVAGTDITPEFCKRTYKAIQQIAKG